jgi:hypothetical protein
VSQIRVDEYELINLYEDKTEWVSAEKRIEQFLVLYLDPKYFQKIVIINSKYLRNAYSFFQSEEEVRAICELREGKVLYDEIYKACFSHGHMSVFFLVNENSDLLLQYLNGRQYKYNKSLDLAKNDKSLPLERKDMMICLNHLSKLLVNNNVITFAHDGDCFFVFKKEKV